MKKQICLALAAVIMAVVVYFLFRPNPGIYDAEIRSTTEGIREGNLTLMIYTDLHHDPSKDEPHVLTEMTDVMAELWKRNHIDALWNLGDLINGHNTTKMEAIEQIREVEAAEKKVTTNVHRIQGNHDDNTQSTYPGNAGYGTEEVLTVSELNDVLMNTETEQTEHHSFLRPTDYYVDINGIRIVCITADYNTFQPETAEWLMSEALAVELPVLILSHIPTRPEWGFREDVENGEMIEATLEDFISSGGTIIAYIHGHDHGDMINEVIGSDGATLYSEVAIGCARFQVPTGNGTPGMAFQERNENDATRLLFDVVTVDMNAREVRFVRFGAGENRIIHF